MSNVDRFVVGLVAAMWVGVLIYASIPDPEAIYRGPCPCAQKHTECLSIPDDEAHLDEWKQCVGHDK